MTEILIVSKQAKTYSESEVVDLFNTAKSLSDIKKVVENSEDRLYTSWATVDAVDKEGQKIPIDEAIKQQEILMNRDAPIQDTHTNKNIGKTLAYRVLTHPLSNTTGILQLNKIYKDNMLDDKVWSETVSGERTGSSVGGFSTDIQMESNGSSVFESLKGFNWLETSNVVGPCNPYATNQAVSLIAKQDKMVENTQIKKEGEMATETPDTSMEDRISKLEEGLGAVISKLDELVQATAGTPEVEKAEDNSEETPKEETEDVKEAEDNSEAEETDNDGDEVAKSLKEVKAELVEVRKQLEANKVVSVVKSERPAMSEKKTFVFSDVMKGKVSLNEFTQNK